MAESRVQKTLLNAKVNLIFYFLNLAVTFFSRKVFLDSLGADFFGLTSTILGFIGFLSLVELGIGSAISVTLYKPMYDKDYPKLNEIISVLGYLYYIVGFVILICGIGMAIALPFLFEEKGVSLFLVYSLYSGFLLSVLLTYFVNFRQTILNADQKSYIVNGCFQGASFLCYLLQMVVVYYVSNYTGYPEIAPYLWILIYLSSNIGAAIYLNVKIKKLYPWLDAKIQYGKNKWRDYPDVIKKTKQLFIHKITQFAQLQIRPLIMFNFVDLTAIGKYDNYNLTAGKLSSLISYVLSGNVAGIGNLIAEGNEKSIHKVYWEFFALKFFVAGILSFGLWYLTEPFLTCWLGGDFLLSKTLLLLIVINEFILQVRFTTDAFINGYGLFSDVWAPIVEGIISVLVAVAGGYFWGIEGVLLGTIVSMSTIVGLWKPYFLFKEGFKTSVVVYWKNFSMYILSFGASFYISSLLVDFITIDPFSSFVMWTLYAAIIVSIFILIFSVVLYSFTIGYRDLAQRVAIMAKSKFGR